MARLVRVLLSAAPEKAFDRPAHKTAIAGEVGALEKLVIDANAAEAAVEANADNISRKVDRWVVDLFLADTVKAGLDDVVSLYRQEKANEPE